jgi:hypothetical protein
MVHSSGMNWPVASQKGAMPPLLSNTGIGVAPNKVPTRNNMTCHTKVLLCNMIGPAVSQWWLTAFKHGFTGWLISGKCAQWVGLVIN